MVLALEELVRALTVSGLPAGWGAQREILDAMEVPRLLREAMVDQTTGFSAHAMAVVRAAAVLRVPAAEDLIAAVASAEPAFAEADEPRSLASGGRAGTRGSAPDALPGHGAGGGANPRVLRPPSDVDAGSGIREALLAGVLHDFGGDRYGFRHSLAQQAAYDSLPSLDRRRLYRRVMAVLVDVDPPPVQLAYHAPQVGDLDAWLRYSEAAVDAARELGDTAVAA